MDEFGRRGVGIFIGHFRKKMMPQVLTWACGGHHRPLVGEHFSLVLLTRIWTGKLQNHPRPQNAFRGPV
jgi:hypothetical protein